MEGVIHEYDPHDPEHQEWTKVKHVPKDLLLATFDGCWHKRVYWKRVTDPVRSMRMTPSTFSSLMRMHVDQAYIDRSVSDSPCADGSPPYHGSGAV